MRSRQVITTTVLGITLLAAGCSGRSDGPPEIIVDRSACSHCGMLVSEPIYTAAYQVRGSEAKVFDDIACMLENMRQAAIRPESGAGVRVWFHDANDGKWIDGDAVFVASSSIRTPMGGGILAFRDAAAAELAAGRHKGQVVRSMPELTRLKGDQ